MRNRLLIYIFFISLLLTKIGSICKAQTPQLKEYSNKLLFNFYTDMPDSNLCRFIQKHISSIYCQPKSRTDTVQGWSANDRHKEIIYPPLISTHSLYLTKHPFLNEKYSTSKIQIRASETIKDRVEIEELSLFLYFRDKEDAINLYNKMVDTLTKMSSLKRFTNYDKIKKAEFTDNTIKNKPEFGVQLILTNDGIPENSSYYILFIPHNNLY